MTLQTSRTGLHILKLAGVGHFPASALLVLEQAGQIQVEARLQRPAFRGVDWANAQLYVMGASQRPKLQPQPDGTFAAEAATKEAAPGVRIASMTNHTRNFTLEGAAGYRLPDEMYSDYSYHLAVIKPVGGKARVVLDPKKLRPSARPAEVRGKGLKAEYARLQESWRMKGQLEKELAWLGWAEARFSYPFIVPAADAQRIAAEIRPDSPVWRLQPSVLGGVLAGNDQGSLESPYAAKAPAAFSGNAANSLLSALYTSLLHTGRYEQLKPAMARLHAASPDSGMTKSALRKVGGMELLTVPGRKVPAFELPMKTAKKYLQSGTQ